MRGLNGRITKLRTTSKATQKRARVNQGRKVKESRACQTDAERQVAAGTHEWVGEEAPAPPWPQPMASQRRGFHCMPSHATQRCPAPVQSKSESQPVIDQLWKWLFNEE
ncbi:hypothetical protein ACJ72_01707 [Emergomyces africanus]|uniref:Uncharacterized protein n=1 Tax=Emergomyces africanus TaxID=1955775 RepID=A0A1B7P4H3_9EURO|nr:hypothetical protein ACJ72_01707 [Emergomyces africanus]